MHRHAEEALWLAESGAPERRPLRVRCTQLTAAGMPHRYMWVPLISSACRRALEFRVRGPKCRLPGGVAGCDSQGLDLVTP